MPRKLKRERSTIPGLRRRGRRAYWSRELPAGVGGDRLQRALEADWGTDVATTRAAALNTLYDRGDWTSLRRWAAGEIHASRIVTAQRDGDYQSLLVLDREGVRLGPAVDDHLQRTEATWTLATLRTHRSVCNTLLAELPGGRDFDMSELTQRGAEKILHKPRIRDEDGNLVPWSESSQQTVRTSASKLWQAVIEQQAEKAEMHSMIPALVRNPWRKASVRGRRRTRPPVLTPDEIRGLLTHEEVKETPTATMLAIGLLAGLRQSEILNLRHADVFMDEGEPFLRVQSRKGQYAWSPKTERSERDVPMTAALVSIVRDHIARGYSGTRYLITSRGVDRPINPTTSDGWTERAFTAAGLTYGRKSTDGLTIHHTRHSYATLLLSSGVSIAAVAELLGDKQETVLSTYSHALPNDRARAKKILEGVL